MPRRIDITKEHAYSGIDITIHRAADLLEQRQGGVTATATNPLHLETNDPIM